MPTVCFTDGSCDVRTGAGGWAYFICNRRLNLALVGAGYATATTNNAMELTAIQQALLQLRKPCSLQLFSDSQYCIRALSEWHFKWRKSSWLTAEGTPVKNRELIESITNQHIRLDVQYHWVKGHAGHYFNELVDALAGGARRTCRAFRHRGTVAGVYGQALAWPTSEEACQK